MNTSRHVALAIIVAGLASAVTTVSANAEIVRACVSRSRRYPGLGQQTSAPVFMYAGSSP